MTPRRRILALAAGLGQAALAVVVALLSVESLGLVGDGKSSVDWALAGPALVLLVTIGFSTGLATGRVDWIRVGLGATATAVVLGAGASLIGGSAAAGALVFVAVQLAPAVLPERRAGA